jgi:hypothetical protein
MLCATILTLAFVSSSNVYSEESYIVDTASEAKTQAMDCAMNTADVKLESGFYWNASDKELTKYLARYNIKVDLPTLDSINVTQEMLSDGMIP